MSARLVAANVIYQVLQEQRSLANILPDYKAKLSGADQALMQELVFGVLRYFFQLEAVCQELMDKPIKQKDIILQYLLMLGLYQLKFMRLPAYAAISETVNVTKQLKRTSAKALVNAVLRNYQRQAETFSWPEVCNQPQWLREYIEQHYPQAATAIFEACEQRPPLVVYWLPDLPETTGAKLKHCPHALQLDPKTDVQEFPGFNEGLFQVQDGAAQLAAPLLELGAGQRVLDACAAPGGKSVNILHQQPKLKELVACDISTLRLQRTTENLRRLKFAATLKQADLADHTACSALGMFDRILLDAPCSALGVIRRHPDIKFLRNYQQLKENQQLQLKLLQNLWPQLNPGGILLYVTCSIADEENDQVIAQFLQHQQNATILTIEAQWGQQTQFGRQILPGTDNLDGFYFCKLIKQQ